MTQPKTPEILDDEAPLLSRIVNVATLPKKGQRLKFEADAELLIAMAARFEIDAVESFEADAEIMPWKRGGITVKGKVRSSLIQPCAITGEPLQTLIDEWVDMTLVPDGSPLAVPEVSETGELILDPDGADLPETFASHMIDVGAIWLEHFALGFDPYARKDGADFSQIADGLLDTGVDADGVKTSSPFAALAALKEK